MNQIDRTQLNRLERDLTVWLTETAAPHTPPYLDDILQQTAGLRQRPRWTFLERLIPMTVTTSFRAMTRPVPWRMVGALALLLVALLVGAILVGSAQRRLPAPFGLAAPGLVAYSSEGDIFVVDPATNQPRSIVVGPETDLNPQWSRDGTRIVFARGEGILNNLFTVHSDGSILTQVTPKSVGIVDDPLSADYSFSPDGQSVLFLTASAIGVAKVDGSGVTEIPTPETFLEAAWRPPDGSQIGALGVDGGIYLVDVADGTIETIVSPDPDSEGIGLTWSPDGSEVAYSRWNDTTAVVATIRSYITEIATRAERRADPAGSDAFFDGWATWSNDGRRIVLMRAYTDGFTDTTAMIIGTDGTGSRIETAHGLGLAEDCCAAFEWAPDDSSILWTPVNSTSNLRTQLQINPDTGAVTAVPWNAASDPAWQRLAP